MTYLLIGFMVAVEYAAYREKKNKKVGIFEFILTVILWPMLVMDRLLDIWNGVYDLWKKEIKVDCVKVGNYWFIRESL